MRFLHFGKHLEQAVGVGSYLQLHVVKERPSVRLGGLDNHCIISFLIRHRKLHATGAHRGRNNRDDPAVEGSQRRPCAAARSGMCDPFSCLTLERQLRCFKPKYRSNSYRSNSSLLHREAGKNRMRSRIIGNSELVTVGSALQALCLEVKYIAPRWPERWVKSEVALRISVA